MTPVPMEWRLAEPAPVEIASGIAPGSGLGDGPANGLIGGGEAGSERGLGVVKIIDGFAQVSERTVAGFLLEVAGHGVAQLGGGTCTDGGVPLPPG